jgi:hypothetical protein
MAIAENVINFLDQQKSPRAKPVASGASTRKTRKPKVYKNPHSGELVETKSGNHKTSKKWKTKHG